MTGTKTAAILLVGSLILCGCSAATQPEAVPVETATESSPVTTQALQQSTAATGESETTEVAETTGVMETTEGTVTPETTETVAPVQKPVQQTPVETTPTEQPTTAPAMPDHGIDLPEDNWD